MRTINSDLYRYYHNITSNSLVVLKAMIKHGVQTLIYSSTCATYGEPEKMPITEETPQVRSLSNFWCIFSLTISLAMFFSLKSKNIFEPVNPES